MKAAVVATAGDAPEYRDFLEPKAGPGRQIVALVASAIHPVVRAKASANHYSSTGQYPLVPGVDAVARTAEGTLVYTGGAEEPWGTFAEHIAVPAAMTLPLPDGADPVAVAGSMNPGMSSWMPLATYAGHHGTPDTVVVLGATGAAGGLAVQNALALGARRVIGIGRGAEDLKRVAGLGAEVVELLGHKDADATTVHAALGDKSPEVVLDYLWGSPAEAIFQALETIAGTSATTYVQIGSAAGEQAVVPASLLRSRPFEISGSGIGSFDMRNYAAHASGYLKLIAEGEVHLDVQAYSLSRVSEAWRAPAGPRPVLTAD